MKWMYIQLTPKQILSDQSEFLSDYQTAGLAIKVILADEYASYFREIHEKAAKLVKETQRGR